MAKTEREGESGLYNWEDSRGGGRVSEVGAFARVGTRYGRVGSTHVLVLCGSGAASRTTYGSAILHARGTVRGRVTLGVRVGQPVRVGGIPCGETRVGSDTGRGRDPRPGSRPFWGAITGRKRSKKTMSRDDGKRAQRGSPLRGTVGIACVRVGRGGGGGAREREMVGKT
ncbi:hypothetical protein BHM03_00020354 [Ensete ventricosum]|nr:hypothetical protein BHM03_00020354 [Ensete ventricosum]